MTTAIERVEKFVAIREKFADDSVAPGYSLRLDDLRVVVALAKRAEYSEWNGLCFAGKHGLDYPTQPCDRCAASKRKARAKSRR